MATKAGEKTRARLEKKFPRVKERPPEVVVAGGRAWVKVDRPTPWRPPHAGDELVGEYVGRSTRPSSHGTGVYGVITIRTNDGVFTLSGVVITSLFEAANPPSGAAVRIVYKGEQHAAMGGYAYRTYDLFLAKDEQAR